MLKEFLMGLDLLHLEALLCLVRQKELFNKSGDDIVIGDGAAVVAFEIRIVDANAGIYVLSLRAKAT